VAVLSKITGLGVQRSYPQQKLANHDLVADLARARWVKVLTGRGNELTRDSFHQVWQDADSRLESVQILLPNPEAGHASFLDAREAEIRRYDSGYTPGLLTKQIKTNIEYISTLAGKRQNIEFRQVDLPQVCRIIATDRVAYFTIYAAHAHGRNSPCIVFSNPGPLYDLALRIFAVIWNNAAPPMAAPGVNHR
jgi:hypothetical protein